MADNMEPELEAYIQRIVDQRVEEAIKNKGPCKGACSTSKVQRIICGPDSRLSGAEMRIALRGRTGNARYGGPPVPPGGTASVVIPAYAIGYKLGPFNFRVDMDTGGIPQDVVVTLSQAGETIHQFSADEYQEDMCCAHLRRNFDDCLGWTSTVVLTMQHTGNPGDPDLLRGRINFRRIFFNDPTWQVCPPWDRCSEATYTAWVNGGCGQGGTLGPQSDVDPTQLALMGG